LRSNVIPFKKLAGDKPAATSSMRVLALMTDAFGGHGGIAQYNQQFLSSLAACTQIEEVAVLPFSRSEPSPRDLPHRVHQHPCVSGKFAYSIAAFAEARAHGPISVVFCGHILMAPLAAIVAKLMGAQLWVQAHGVDVWQELSWLYRRSIESADLVIAVSRDTRRRLLAWIRIDPARVKVLPNTVDPRFRPGPKPGYLLDRYALHGKKVLLTVSRLSAAERYKGHDRVIYALPRVLAEHPEAMYLIAGNGDDRPRLEAFAAELRVAQAVRFVGSVAPEELPDHYRLADVFVMPSMGEGFGIVFLEAMASGIRVIGGNKDGSLDPLGDGMLGTTIDPENVDELASAIRTALGTAPANVDGAARFKAPVFAEHLQALIWSTLVTRH
jgi:phosphatidyl-myo-inositol dimannoside synthase